MQPGKSALGYTRIVGLAAATSIGTIPAGAETVLLQTETQDVRYRDDGTDPTAAVGMLLKVNTFYEFTVQQLAQMKLIQVAVTATLNISFYGTKA